MLTRLRQNGIIMEKKTEGLFVSSLSLSRALWTSLGEVADS